MQQVTVVAKVPLSTSSYITTNHTHFSVVSKLKRRYSNNFRKTKNHDPIVRIVFRIFEVSCSYISSD